VGNIDVAKRFTDALEARDLDLAGAMMADEFKAIGPSLHLTKPQTMAYLQRLFTAFPDYSFNFEGLEQAGDHVHCYAHERGTHLGTLDLNTFGMPLVVAATGKSFHLPKSAFTFQADCEKVTSFKEEVQQGGGLAGMLAQLGVKGKYQQTDIVRAAGTPNISLPCPEPGSGEIRPGQREVYE
jgi:predicted ester cyclase